MHSWRQLLLGRPLPTRESEHQKLPKYLALPVFASDAVSSVAYATEEILLALTLGAGVAVPLAIGKVFPISAAIAVLLVIVVFSYRQTIFAYPNGGGAYVVSKDNLGPRAGLVAGAALMIDYVLTVSVSVAAGVAAIISAAPQLAPLRVQLCLAFVGLITVANLRGLREAGRLFMLPTYSFLICIYTLVAVGLFKHFTGTLGQHVVVDHPAAAGAAPLTLFLILKAFSSGCVAMTGTEAVSNGVPAFRAPESRNAAATLVMMAGILGSLFLGVSFLAWKYQALPDHEHAETVVSILASGIFGRGAFYYAIQFTTFMLLIVAANTSFADFPRLTRLMAEDRYLPRQLANIGDRLVFSNGILLLAVLASVLIVAFGGITHHLIPLYSVGVFLSFTLSQAGMVVRWFRRRGLGWPLSAAISGFGAGATFGVLCVVAYTKFAAGDPVSAFPLTTPLGYWALVTAALFVAASMANQKAAKLWLALSVIGFALWATASGADLFASAPIHVGAWLVVVTISLLVWMFRCIAAHYGEVAEHLTMARFDPAPRLHNTVLVLVPGIHRGVMVALQYARSISEDVRGVYVEIDPERTQQVRRRWEQYAPDVPLVVLESPYRSLVDPILRFIDQVEAERADDVVTVVLPEFVTEKWWTKLLHNQSGLLLKWALLFKKGVVVANIRYFLEAHVTEMGDHPLTSHRDAPPAESPSPPRAE